MKYEKHDIKQFTQEDWDNIINAYDPEKNSKLDDNAIESIKSKHK